MKKNITKKNKAVTLIALVVTIIVLIIIAAVSISLILGNNGIINKSQEGRNNYTLAANEEEYQMGKVDSKFDTYISGNRNYETEINNLKTEIQKLKNANTYSQTEQIVGTWIDNKNIYKRTWDYGSRLNVSNTSWTDTNISISDNKIDHVIKAEAVSAGTYNDDCCWALHAHTEDSVTSVHVLAPRSNGSISCRYFTLYYTKTQE